MIMVRWTAVLLSLVVLTGESQVRHPVGPQRGDVSLIRGPSGLRTRASDDTVRVLAALVQFRPDADPRSAGDGQFDLSAPRPEMPDPPPHDSSFFAGKLQFLANYFRKASNSQLAVAGTVLPGIVTLDDSMAVYSPRGEDNAPLARLFVDSWSRAIAAQPSFPFDQFDAFVIFHAGAGRDVDLVSILGYDPTPNDIPSLYMNLATIREFLGDPAFPGVQAPSSGFFITNSLILPETETRILDTGLGRDTLRLSINGIAAATMGSHLGLPDLFDVTTGRSGIGQFGLMDGAGIFAFNGLFPPEPSAWEKITLGWLTPIDVAPGIQTLSVPAAGFFSAGADTVYRVMISPEEYFLIENRQRDPNGDGQRLTVVQNGVVRELHFQGDTAGFSFDDISAVRGSVIDVEDLDWATPGSTLQEGFEGGGILVWHINERVIQEALATNTINADPERRGVDLEEADGSQDIGQSYEFLQPGSGTEFGWPLDLWFLGNESPVYTNRFDERSYPNTLSATGARSLVTMRDFTARSSRMGLTVEIGSSGFEVIGGLDRTLEPRGPSVAPSLSSSGIYVSAGDSLFAFNADGSSKTVSADGFLGLGGGPFPVAVLEREEGRTVVAAARDSSLVLYELRDNDSDGLFESVSAASAALGGAVSSAPAFRVAPSRFVALVGLSGGGYAQADSSLNVSVVQSASVSAVTALAQLPPEDADSLPAVYALAGNRLFSAGGSADLPPGESAWSIAAYRSVRGNRIIAVGSSGGRMIVLDGRLSIVVDVLLATDSLRGMAVGDLDGDGSKEVVLCGISTLRAVNESGFMIDGFPSIAGQVGGGSLSPRIGDLDADGSPDILVVSSRGELTAVSGRGEILAGFPVQAFGHGVTRLGIFQGPAGNLAFLGVTAEGAMKAFETAVPHSAETVAWGQEFGDALHRNADLLLTSSPTPISSDFFPRARLYNWPNPVYGDETQIRYYVADDAEIRVTIFDLTGLAVAELKTQATGGLDGEVSWDVRGIDSGIYLARVQASSPGRTDVAVIKIAVVK